MSYNRILRLQLVFFNSLLNDLKKEKIFIKEHFNLLEVEYLFLLEEVVGIINSQENLIKALLKEVKIKKRSGNIKYIFLEDHIQKQFLNVYDSVKSLYVWYKPYHNEDISFLRSIRTSFTNPLYWYERMAVKFNKIK
jgi:hypothetical protein